MACGRSSTRCVAPYPRGDVENHKLSQTQNCRHVCGKSLDALWQLEKAHTRVPQWHARMDPKVKKQTEAGYDSDEPPNLVPFKNKNKSGPGARRAITHDDGNDTDGSMPSLQTVSDSDDEDGDEFESEEESGVEDDSEASDSEYDTDDEDQLREMFREAMDTAAATPDFFDPRAAASEFDTLAADRKGNPFIKMLGNLRGE